MISNQNKECPICREKIVGQTLIVCPNPKMNHNYHEGCLEKWAKCSIRSGGTSLEKGFKCLMCTSNFNLKISPFSDWIKKYGPEYRRERDNMQRCGRAVSTIGLFLFGSSFSYGVAILQGDQEASPLMASAALCVGVVGWFVLSKGAEIYVEAGGMPPGERHQE